MLSSTLHIFDSIEKAKENGKNLNKRINWKSNVKSRNVISFKSNDFRIKKVFKLIVI